MKDTQKKLEKRLNYKSKVLENVIYVGKFKKKKSKEKI